jgi:hypothetical protein
MRIEWMHSGLRQGEMEEHASTIQMLGAGGFGALIGWYIYYLVRHRTDQVTFSDLGTLIAVIGGGAVLTLFPAKSDLFGAYGVGLFAGFFGYFLFLLVFVIVSGDFGLNWFLDGRRKLPAEDETDAGPTPMGGA